MLKTVDDFVEIEVTAVAIEQSSSFKIGFKLVSACSAKKLIKLLKTSSYEKQFAILHSNIVYATDVKKSDGSLTNSFENAIIKPMLKSMPYFAAILSNYLSLLANYEVLDIGALKDYNLAMVAQSQYEIDYPPEDKVVKETKELQESLGEFMNFDLPDNYVSPAEVKVAKLPTFMWKSNTTYLNIFNLAKIYRTEWGGLNPTVLIELAKEHNLKVSEVLHRIAIMFANYESMKPAEK